MTPRPVVYSWDATSGVSKKQAEEDGEQTGICHGFVMMTNEPTLSAIVETEEGQICLPDAVNCRFLDVRDDDPPVDWQRTRLQKLGLLAALPGRRGAHPVAPLRPLSPV
jgi:hypothetical protein